MPSRDRLVVAIDGPAGAGKSTVSKMVAQALGLPMLDTGAMYRCAGLAALHQGATLDDAEALGALAESLEITFQPGDPQRVMLNGEDVTEAIRTPEASATASKVSTHPPVRRALVARQQALVGQGGWVLEGRDTTTVVAPQADLKVFLTASAEERALRRWHELKSKGQEMPLQDVVKDVVERDHRDYTRQDSPLTLAEDAFLIETFNMSPQMVAEAILARIPS
jgi:cytidylate kinase